MNQPNLREWNKNRGKNTWQNQARFNTPVLTPFTYLGVDIVWDLEILKQMQM